MRRKDSGRRFAARLGVIGTCNRQFAVSVSFRHNRAARSAATASMPDPTALKYRAFISYSHADTDWAKWLHRGLEIVPHRQGACWPEHGNGNNPARATPNLPRPRRFYRGTYAQRADTRRARCVRGSVVICSPASAKSLYVNEEIKLFKSRHPDRPVIPLIVDGKPDDRRARMLPASAQVQDRRQGQRHARRPIELLAADAREESDGKDLALAKVIAGLLGLSSDEVFRRAERERRAATRRRRRVQALVGALALLLIAAASRHGWKQDYLKEQYYWHCVMGPEVLHGRRRNAR